MVWGSRTVDGKLVGTVHMGCMVGGRPSTEWGFRHGHGVRGVPRIARIRPRRQAPVSFVRGLQPFWILLAGGAAHGVASVY